MQFLKHIFNTVFSYKAANPSRTHKAERNKDSGNASVQKSAISIREQARFHEENNDLIDGLLSTLVNNVVGKNGIGVEPMPLNKKGEVHEVFAKQLLDLFAEWSLKPDVTGNYTRPEFERLVCRTWLRDGECIGEQILGRPKGFYHPNGKVPFSIQAMEPDYLPLNLNDEQKRLVQGIEHNRWGQATKYHFLESHNRNNLNYSDKTRSVKSDRVLHLRIVKRLHQIRGVSVLASSLIRIAGLLNYEEMELVAARIAASVAFFIKKADPEAYEVPDSDSDVEERTQFGLAPGTIFDKLKPGEDVGTVESKRPTPLLQKFRDTMVRMICSATGANASTVNKSYDGTFSSQRQELVESYVSYGVLSNAFIGQWSRPIYRQFVEMAILSNAIQVPSDVNPETTFNAAYQAPVMPWIDPVKEVVAAEKAVSAGFKSEADVVRSLGQNPNEVKRQRAKEVKENRDKNLVFSSDEYHKYYGKQNEKPTNDTSASELP